VWNGSLVGENAPVEITTYQVKAYLVGWHDAKDGDIHLILRDPADQRATLIAEIPNPAYAGACGAGDRRRLLRPPP
jgi:hypothetical protein